MWFSLIHFISQAARAEISGFLQQLRFDVTRKDFNAAALQCEMHLRSQLENQAQVAKARAKLLVGVFGGRVCSQFICSDLLTFFPPSSSLYATKETLSMGLGKCLTSLWLLFKRVLSLRGF